MITYKSISLLFSIMLVLIVLLSVVYGIFFWEYILILFFCFLLLLIAGSASICKSFYTNVICRAFTSKKEISLTFDDGPEAEITPRVLDILKSKNIKAAFFVIGEKAEKNPELIRRIHEEGHIIGNHTFGHAFWFDWKCRKAMIKDIEKTDEVVKNIISKDLYLFRPPYGVTNPALAGAVKKLKYKVIGWNIRSYDKNKSPGKVVNRVSGMMKAGGIVLLHDDHNDILEILEGIIEEARKKSFSFVALDKMLKIDAYKND